MKPALLMLALACAPAFALATDETPARSDAGACAVPQIPAVSTSQAGANRIKKVLKKWDACVAAHPGTDPAVVAAVSQQAAEWSRATVDYSTGQGNSNVAARHHSNAKREFEKDIRNAATERMQGRMQ
ncbi:hypothetical protein [Pseudoduganella sp. GCM10020061]|uniref:hypothetical protein n=1 Tax=Pseudoduganella sp. GCM10020061 TaxID=3317345 RepID=UPI0036310A66